MHCKRPFRDPHERSCNAQHVAGASIERSRDPIDCFCASIEGFGGSTADVRGSIGTSGEPFVDLRRLAQGRASRPSA